MKSQETLPSRQHFSESIVGKTVAGLGVTDDGGTV